MFETTTLPLIDLCFITYRSSLRGKKTDPKTDLFTNVDVESVQVDKIKVYDPLKVCLKVLQGIEQGRTRRTSLELKFSPFGRKEELSITKISKSGCVGNGI